MTNFMIAYYGENKHMYTLNFHNRFPVKRPAKFFRLQHKGIKGFMG